MSRSEVEQHVEPEDQARAEWYALISRLFYAPPDRELLQRLGSPPKDDPDAESNGLVDAWRELQVRCQTADTEAVRAEFEALFVGAGRAQVTPYTSAYAASHAPDRHLLELRDRLADWGLARRDGVFEVEDHVSAICDAMRWLIEHGLGLDDQRAFFFEFIEPGLGPFCSAIKRSPTAVFYRVVSDVTDGFMAVEKEAFDLHTST